MESNKDDRGNEWLFERDEDMKNKVDCAIMLLVYVGVIFAMAAAVLASLFL